jgi:hypothetical protein
MRISDCTDSSSAEWMSNSSEAVNSVDDHPEEEELSDEETHKHTHTQEQQGAHVSMQLPVK